MTTTEPTKLNPCVNCGATDLRQRAEWVECRKCGHTLPLDQWNSPAIPYPLSDQQYIAAMGNVCPFCGAGPGPEGVEADDEINLDGQEATVQVDCNRCGARWFDRYQLIGYDPGEMGTHHNEGDCVVCGHPVWTVAGSEVRCGAGWAHDQDCLGEHAHNCAECQELDLSNVQPPDSPAV